MMMICRNSRAVVLIATAIILMFECIFCYHNLNQQIQKASASVNYHTNHHYKQLLSTLGCIAVNRKSGFEYEFDDKIEAGIQLRGTEVKSCRQGNVQLSDGFATVIDGECWLCNVHIAEHHQCGPVYQHELKRNRKLLLHKREVIDDIFSLTQWYMS